MLRTLIALVTLLLATAWANAGQNSSAWKDDVGSIPVQDGGRVMPLQTYATNLAEQLTGRSHWSVGRGPEAFSGRDPIELLFDLMYRPQDVVHKTLIGINNLPFRRTVGLDVDREFFSPIEVSGCAKLEELLTNYQNSKETNPGYQANRDERRALELRGAMQRIADFIAGQGIPVISDGHGKPFRIAGPHMPDSGASQVKAAFEAFGKAYTSGQGLDEAAKALREAIAGASVADPKAAKAIGLEMFYNRHKPWLMTAVAYALALVLLGLSRLVMRRALVVGAVLVTLWGVAEHALGLGLRVAILGRAPVSNTYESLLWMGLVGMGVAGIAQLINRRAWYLVGGLSVGLLSVLFSNLVPLESQTNALPAVLRSNYWLIVHVLTIVSSYGVLALASLLGHVYLVKNVLMARKGDAGAVQGGMAHPLITQTYRAIQLGLLLLTAGTILGGVWAADSWGRFWGWDPKETWALISIVIYFAVLHARYVRWLQDFGMAASAVLSFASIVWTFYGVNYLMASGLHSYGFGNGGGTWVGIWAGAEILFVLVCWWRHVVLARAVARASGAGPQSPSADVKHGVSGA